MFYDLLASGHNPKINSYKEQVSYWIKDNVLSKCDYELDCIDNKWLKKTIGYFFLNANNIWNKHRGKVTGLNVQKQHRNFLDKYIDVTDLPPCTCANCLHLDSSKMKQDQSNSSSSK